eukprot:gene19196-109_t
MGMENGVPDLEEDIFGNVEGTEAEIDEISPSELSVERPFTKLFTRSPDALSFSNGVKWVAVSPMKFHIQHYGAREIPPIIASYQSSPRTPITDQWVDAAAFHESAKKSRKVLSMTQQETQRVIKSLMANPLPWTPEAMKKAKTSMMNLHDLAKIIHSERLQAIAFTSIN